MIEGCPFVTEGLVVIIVVGLFCCCSVMPLPAVLPRSLTLFCLAVTLSLMDCKADATLGGSWMVAGFKG